MEGLILRATPPFSDFLVKINYYLQIDNDCLIWEIINPSASNIFLFYLRHFHPHPTHIPLNSPPRQVSVISMVEFVSEEQEAGV